MIIKDTATLRNFLSVNGSVNHDNIKPYLKKAERSFLKPAIGAGQLTVFDTTQTDVVIKEAQELAQEVVANYGYYLYLPIGAVQITDNGIHVVDNENTKTATDKQFKDLQRSFLKTAHEALDELLAFMELNVIKFTTWSNSENYSVYKDLLVNTTSVFNKFYHIFNSRQTFMALTPNIRITEDRFIKPVIGAELLTALKSKQTDAKRKEVKELLQKSIIAFTVMLTSENAMYVIDGKGLQLRFDVLDYEKKQQNTTNSNTVLTENKKVEGEEYLKIALEIVKANPSIFTEYNEKPQADYINITKTKSIIGL